MLCAWLAPRGMHLSMLSSSMTVNRALEMSNYATFPAKSPATSHPSSRWLRLHAFGRSSRKFSKLARPHREIFVYLRMELNGISSIRVLHPRHLRLNVRDTRDGRLLARCANKRRVAYILVPENYTFLGRILFRVYDENTRV